MSVRDGLEQAAVDAGTTRLQQLRANVSRYFAFFGRQPRFAATNPGAYAGERESAGDASGTITYGV